MKNIRFESQAWRIEALAKAGVNIAVNSSTDEEAGEMNSSLQQLFETIAETANKLAADLEMAGRAAA